MAAGSVGKWSRALTARRSRALIDDRVGRADDGPDFPVEGQDERR